jgi:hypothetical protein
MTDNTDRLASVSSASAEGASGMKTWLGGDAAPADWDGGRVLFRHGGTSTSRPGEGMCWSHGMLGGGKTDIIAYTPKSEPVPATNQAGEVCSCARKHDPDQFDHQDNCTALATQPATSQEGEVFRNDDGDVIARDQLIADFKAWLDPFWVRALEYIAATPTPPTLSEDLWSVAAIDRAERFAKGLNTTPEEHDDIMVAVEIARAARAQGQAS